MASVNLVAHLLQRFVDRLPVRGFPTILAPPGKAKKCEQRGTPVARRISQSALGFATRLVRIECDD